MLLATEMHPKCSQSASVCITVIQHSDWNASQIEAVQLKGAHNGGTLSHLTFEPPRPVLRLVAPRFDDPSPRSSELDVNAERLVDPHIDDMPPAAGDERNIRSCSQSYAAGYARAGSRWARFATWFPSQPRAAPVQKPGRQPACAFVADEAGYFVYGGGGSLLWPGRFVEPENQPERGPPPDGRGLVPPEVLEPARLPQHDLRKLYKMKRRQAVQIM